ncbi:MAG: hypothetical protein V4504_01855 [Patescibacteria group bacterium]
MDSMFGENKNLKDFSNSNKVASSLSRERESLIKDNKISYKKTNKLVTAVYMVTDIMDKNEPMRNKIRTLATEIISDIDQNDNISASTKVESIMSFLDITTTLKMISQMNKNILFREFYELKNALLVPQENAISIDGYFIEEDQNSYIQVLPRKEIFYKGHHNGHTKSTNIGLQKGGTLMKALSDKTSQKQYSEGFDMLKKERRFEIVKVIKEMKQATIKDILQNKTGVLKSCSEKTLQRELIAMIKDNVLNKIGEKRWSKYSLK